MQHIRRSKCLSLALTHAH